MNNLEMLKTLVKAARKEYEKAAEEAGKRHSEPFIQWRYEDQAAVCDRVLQMIDLCFPPEYRCNPSEDPRNAPE